MALTEEQKAKYQRRAQQYGVPSVGEKANDESAGWLSRRGADFPASEGGEYSDVLRMMGNVPSNVRDEVSGLYDIAGGAGQEETNIAHVMLRAMSGAGEDASRRFMGTEDTENAQLFRQSADTIIDRLTSPRKTAIEEPVSTVLDLASLGTRGALKSAVTEPARLAKKAATGAYRGGRAGTQHVAKLSTGHDKGEFEAIRKASAASKASKAEVMPYLREQKTATDFAEVLSNGTARVIEKRRADYVAKLPGLNLRDEYKNVTTTRTVRQAETDARGNPTGKTRRVEREIPDPMGLHSVIKADLLNMVGDDYQIDVMKLADYIQNGDAESLRLAFKDAVVGSRNNQKRIADFFEDVFYWTDDSIFGIDTLKKRIWDFKKKGAEGADFETANAVVERTYGNVRRVLGERVEGYDDMVGAFEEASKFKDAIGKVLGMEGGNLKSIDEKMINKILPMLRDPANYDIRKSLVADLERSIGKPIAGMAAGLSLRKKTPKSLVSRSLLLGGVWRADFSEGPGLGLLADLSVVPFTSPRVVAGLFTVLGSGERTAKNLAEITRDTMNMLPQGVTNDMLRGMSLGRVIERYVVPQLEQLEVRERLSGQAQTGPLSAIHPQTMPPPLNMEELEELTPTSKQAGY
jgi:hypothetical protein